MKNKSKLLFITLSAITAGLLIAVGVMAFTGPGANTAPAGDPSFWLKNGTNMYYSVGNVGIGTTTPATKLQVDGAISGFGIVPIGSIIAWHKSFTNTPALPSGWVEANGQVLNDASSPYNGQTIPNLNGDARFLRGGSTSGALQADEFKAHVHNRGVWDGGVSGGSGGPLTGAQPLDVNTGSTGGSETRPINMSVVWIMRVK